MKGLRKYLTPFAPDQSGAVSVLYEMGGIIVICDAGGCTGNICGFDEPRWSSTRSAVFSAGLRDMDAILGRDDKLVEKLAMAAERIDANFAAIIGTPVPSVIGTDYRALKRLAEKKTELPVITVETTGMRLYDEGADSACYELFRTFSEEGKEVEPGRLGVIGAIPLDFGEGQMLEEMKEILTKDGWTDIVFYGLGSSMDDVKEAGKSEKNLVVSPAGIHTAEFLKNKYGTPYEIACPMKPERLPDVDYNGKKVLVVHQQVIANEIRDMIRARGGEAVDVATWFMLSPVIKEEGDRHLTEEDEFESVVMNGEYDYILADRTMESIVPGYNGRFFHAPHFAVSGKLGDDEQYNH